MKTLLLAAIAAIVVVTTCRPAESSFADGDIIFHESRSAQSQAIQLATRSRYSHMGILVQDGGKWSVFEAVQPVKLTPLDQWIARGKDGHYVIKRLADRTLMTADSHRRIKEVGERMRGRSYDGTFEWSDDKIYCSELVWKIYERALGVRIGELGKLGDFDLSHPEVRKKLAERYGEQIPLDEPVISPVTMFESPLLVEVARH